MPNYNSIEGNVLFPTIDGYDMHKAGDMALYLAHCDFYPFKSVIDNNKWRLILSQKRIEIWRKKQEKMTILEQKAGQ